MSEVTCIPRQESDKLVFHYLNGFLVFRRLSNYVRWFVHDAQVHSRQVFTDDTQGKHLRPGKYRYQRDYKRKAGHLKLESQNLTQQYICEDYESK